jgi:hypothetical protein
MDGMRILGTEMRADVGFLMACVLTLYSKVSLSPLGCKTTSELTAIGCPVQ